MGIVSDWLHRPFSKFFLGELVVLGLMLVVARARFLRRGQPERWRRLRHQLPTLIGLLMGGATPGLFHGYNVWSSLWAIAMFSLIYYGYRLSIRNIQESSQGAGQEPDGSELRGPDHK